MARFAYDFSKEHKNNFKAFIENDLINTFQCEILDKGEDIAKISLLENKQEIIQDIFDYIEKLKRQYLNGYNAIYIKFSQYYSSLNYEEIYTLINNIYLKVYNETFKAYKIQEKASKQYAKTIIYNEITENIEENIDKHDLDDIISYIKTNDYKKLLVNSINKEYNIDICVLNDIYTSCLNKAIAPYKEDLKVCIDNKKYEDKLQQEQELKARKNKIPLGWKVYGATKIFNKLWK